MGRITFDDAALQVSVQKCVAVSVKDSIGKEISSPTFCSSLAKSLITPAANSVVKASLKDSNNNSFGHGNL